MWNRSYRWQRLTRVGAGTLVVAILVGEACVLQNSAAVQRAKTGGRDLLGEISSPKEALTEVELPSSLSAMPGTLVYLERADGVAQVIGRVTGVQSDESPQSRVQIRMWGNFSRSGVLKGAPASLNLRDAVRLLINPDLPDDEAQLARDAIWPSMRQHVVPGMIDSLVREVSREVAGLDQGDRALLRESVEALRTTFKPLEEELVARLAERAKDAVGITGVASGVWRTTADGVKNSGFAVADFWRWAIGGDVQGERIDRPFFSEQTSNALAAAMEEETLLFWHDHRREMIEALTKVAIDRGDDFKTAFNERWATLLYERAVQPAWLAGQNQVIEAMQVYAHDFAARRLLAGDGGPRLLFAYALRSSLDISSAPLLIFAPAEGDASGKIVYEPLLK